MSPALVGRFFTTEPPGEPQKVILKVRQSGQGPEGQQWEDKNQPTSKKTEPQAETGRLHTPHRTGPSLGITQARVHSPPKPVLTPWKGMGAMLTVSPHPFWKGTKDLLDF